MSDIVRPDQEEYDLLVEELRQAKRKLYSFKLLSTLENTKLGGGARWDDLLEYHAKGSSKIPRGAKLRQEFKAQSEVVAVLEAALEDWGNREEAWVEAQPRPETEVVELTDKDAGEAAES